MQNNPTKFNGQMISFGSNDFHSQGYLAKSAIGQGPAVIVFHEWWGLVDHIRSVCDRLAEVNFTAFAPDLYQGERPSSPEDANKLMMSLNLDKIDKLIQGAIELLLLQDCSISKTVGTLGFCMGGYLSLRTAVSASELVSACVDFYGIHPSLNLELNHLRAPVLGIFAEQDQTISAEAIEKLGQSLQEANKAFTFHRYKDSEHAFFNDSRPSYNRSASEQAWRQTVDFLKDNVK